MDEERALRIMDEELDTALGGVVAPPQLAAAVLRRVAELRLTRLPEILDLIGSVAVLVVVFVLLLPFVPMLTNVWWAAGVSIAMLMAAMVFGIRALREP